MKKAKTRSRFWTYRTIKISMISAAMSLLILTFQNFLSPGSYTNTFWENHSFLSHPRTAVATSSCLLGCDSTDFTSMNALDSPEMIVPNKDPKHSWSSQHHPSPNATEWIAVWWDEARMTTGVRLRFKQYKGRAMGMPESIDIYYSAQGQWKFLTTRKLPKDNGAHQNKDGSIDLFGFSATTDGMLFTTSKLKNDGYGAYYFQVEEIYAGEWSWW